MKAKILKVFASILMIIGAIVIAVNIFYLLSGKGVYWIPGHWDSYMQVLSKGSFTISGWFDLQVSNKLHIPFIAKALVLLLVSAIVWIRGGEFIRREKTARWMVLALLCVGIALGVTGIALSMLGEDQFSFTERNGSALNLIVTILFILMGLFIIRGSSGLINRNRMWYWIMGGFFVIGACNEIANFFVAIPFWFSMNMKDVLANWHGILRWCLEAGLYLVLFTGALLLLIWLRSELSETSDSSEKTAEHKSILKLD